VATEHGRSERVAAPGERANHGTAAPAYIAFAARVDRPDEHARSRGLTAGDHPADPRREPDLDGLELDRDVRDVVRAAHQSGLRFPLLGINTPSVTGSGGPPIAVDSADSTMTPPASDST